jgi:hypothetical protein
MNLVPRLWRVILPLAWAWAAGGLMPPSAQAAGPWYVAPQGSDGNTCAAPAEACATIDGAIARALPGDTVYVTASTYTGTGYVVVTIDKDLTLSGGWDAAFSTQSGWSTIDGQGQRTGIGASANAVSIERFVVQNGIDGISNSGNLTLSDSIVTGNRWTGIYSVQSTQLAQVVVNNSLINHNLGRGIYSGHVTLTTLNASAVIGNRDGGIFSDHAGHVVLNNSTVAGNSTRGFGGGIFAWACASDPAWWDGSLTLNNVTISGNTAGNSGGGLSIQCATVNARNSIVAGNQASASPDCDNFAGPFASIGYNLFGDLTGCAITLGAGDLTLANPTLGELVGSPPYYPLLAGSPAIDAGHPAGCTGSSGPLFTDQRGAPRTGHCDIGAYEYTVPGPAASVSAWAGTPQMAPPGTVYGSALRAAVLDSQSSPVGGVLVTFTAPASGASGTFADSGTPTTTAATNAAGIATAAPFTANGQTGGFAVEASAGGAAEPANFLLGNWYLRYLPVMWR